MKTRILHLLGALALSGVAASGNAAIMTYDDRAAFVAATGATGVGTYSATTGSTATLMTGDIVLTSAAGTGNSLNTIREWSTLIPGTPDLAINGIESFNAATAFDMYSFGFDFHEPSGSTPPNPSFPDTCNAPCFDSTFRVTLLDGATVVGMFDFNRPDDSLEFVGVSSDVAFRRVEIREIVGDIDNEFFGNFLRGTQPARVPEPGGLVLLGLGLVGLALARRRSR